jgi:thiosulfate/3-mercaptopyruvate sulfurtransferase
MSTALPFPLITVAQLKDAYLDDALFIVDTRFRLDDTTYGARAFADSHIPGSVYLDLDRDLSAPVVPGVTGRHPLPDPAELAEKLSAAGLRPEHHVIAYDDGPGFYAARLWWLLRWLGHTQVAVLDGGWAAWQRSGGVQSSQSARKRLPGKFVGQPDSRLLVTADDIVDASQSGRFLLLDARAEERFRGEVEPIDPVAGHIPGARCLSCAANLGADGMFLPPEQLRQRFPVPGPGQQLVCYCGSGVTACHNILAAAIAGLALPLLYPGSWSEWITDPDRPVGLA